MMLWFDGENKHSVLFEDYSVSRLHQSKYKFGPVMSHRMWREKSDLHQLDFSSSLKAELETMDKLEFPSPSSCFIYRVLPRLRNMNEAAYTPVSVSIGPYHHGNKGLESMEEDKLWFLYKFLKRTEDKSVNDYVHLLKGQEGKIRPCYSETIPMESDEFVRMILTDACFIIEYFLLWEDEYCWHSKLWLIWAKIRTDLILLENQLPFFVLKDLFDLTFPNGYNGGRLPIEFLTFSYVSQHFMQVPNDKLRERFTFEYFEQHHLPRLPDRTPQVHHLCDMLRICYVRLDQLPREDNDRKLKPVYSARKLHDAGIKFVVNEDEISILKLKFSKGVLEIPKIIIQSFTEVQLRNVVAFEQCHFHPSRSMTDYIILLGFLIRTEKDVQILDEKGIMQNLVGENDAVASVTKLFWHTGYISFNEDYLSLFEELNKFCDSSYHKYKAIFKQQYWSTPWRIASFLGAILLLLLTLIQTISSFIALFQK